MNYTGSSASERLIFADADNRDVSLYPSGNSYVLHLTRPIRNIERVDLVSARVPNTMYNLTNGSNVFSFNSSNVSLNQGFYGAYTLAQAVTSNALVTLDYLQQEGHFIFSSASAFTLKIQSSEFGTMVGLAKGTYTASLATPLDPAYSGKYIVKSTTLVDFSLNEYIYLDIDELRTPFNVDTGALQGTTGTISGSNANRSFAPIIMDVGSACIKNFHENKDYRVSVDYPEPINSLQRLTVRWVDKSGNLLDFRGWNTNAFILRLHLTPDPEPTLPPPQPLEEIQIKRIVEAMKVQPPPPPEPGIRKRIPWWIIVLVILGAFVAYKSWPRGTGQTPQGSGLTAPGLPLGPRLVPRVGS
jgi:hypothetical protein